MFRSNSNNFKNNFSESRNNYSNIMDKVIAILPPALPDHIKDLIKNQTRTIITVFNHQFSPWSLLSSSLTSIIEKNILTCSDLDQLETHFKLNPYQWLSISQRNDLTDDFIDKYQNRLNFDQLSFHLKFWQLFRYENKVNWKVIRQRRNSLGDIIPDHIFQKHGIDISNTCEDPLIKTETKRYSSQKNP